MPKAERVSPRGFTRLARFFAQHLRSLESSRWTWELLDSADWRLHRGGGWLVLERGARSEPARLLWIDRRTGYRFPAGELAVDLPCPGEALTAALPGEEGAWRRRVIALLGPRALLPVAQLHVTRRVFDSETGPALRAVLEEHRTIGRGGRLAARGHVAIHLEPSAGAEPRAEQLAGELREAVPFDGDVFHRALAARGRRAGDGGKLALQLEPGLSAGAACRRYLAEMLVAFRRQLPGAIERWDSEFLHDLRVALRRARSVLAALGGELPAEPAQALAGELRWLFQTTGPTRDLDVLSDELAEGRALATDRINGARTPVVRQIQVRRVRAQEDLVGVLTARRVSRLMALWRKVAGGGPAEGEPPEGPPALALLGRRVWKLYKDLVRDPLPEPLAPEALHELRKRAKKLRYLIELVRELGGRTPNIRRVLGVLKALQDTLGQYQDRAVQVELMFGLGHELAADPDAVFAAGMMAGEWTQEQELARQQVADRLAALATSRVKKVLSRLRVRSEPAPAAQAPSEASSSA